MKLVKASLCVLLIAPMVSFAEDSTTRPSAAPPPPQQSSAGSQAYRIGPEELREFLQEHAPNRLEFLNNLPEMGEGRRRVMTLWRDRLRAMVRIKEQDPELYMRMVRQFELQDQALGLVRKAKPGDPPSKELRDAVAELVHTGITLRQQRIAKLEKALQTEKEKLAADQNNQDKLVDQQLESLRKEGRELVRRMNSGTANASPESR
jgi:hypothetical protein